MVSRRVHGEPSGRLRARVGGSWHDLCDPGVGSHVAVHPEGHMQPQNHSQVEREFAIETLNALMRGELAAVDTYRHAIVRLGNEAPEDLAICLQSHDHRATRLAEHIVLVGGTPVSGSGFWGAFARVVEGSAALIGPRVLFAALYEGEDQGLTDYRAALGRVDAPALALLRTNLLPEQVRTHGLMSMLCRRTAADA